MKERSSLRWVREAHAKRNRIIGVGILSVIALLVFTAFNSLETHDIMNGLVSGGMSMAAVLPAFMKEDKFIELKGSEWELFKKEATAEQLAEYFSAKNEAKVKALEEAIEKRASKEDIDALKNELTKDRIEQMKSLNEVLKEQGLMIKKLSEKEKEEKGAVKGSVLAGLESVKDQLKDLSSGKSKDWVSFSAKVAGTMTISGNVSGGNVPVEQRLPGLDTIASRRIRLMDLVSRGVAQSRVISWVSQANKDGAAGGTSEGALKNQIDFDLVVTSQSLKKRTAFIKVSDEMLDDVDFMNTEINNELIRELMKDIENQVYQGDNTGNNLNGIRTIASAFAAGTFALTVDNANFVDVLRVAINQIDIADQDAATAILAHPSDVTALLLIKASSTDRRYIDALQIVGGQLMLDGIPIIKTTLVTQDEYLVGSFPNATVWDKGEIDIEVGLDSDDFTKNLRTVRAEWQGLNIVKTNKRPSFVAGTISTDAAALETP